MKPGARSMSMLETASRLAFALANPQREKRAPIPQPINVRIERTLISSGIFFGSSRKEVFSLGRLRSAMVSYFWCIEVNTIFRNRQGVGQISLSFVLYCTYTEQIYATSFSISYQGAT